MPHSLSTRGGKVHEIALLAPQPEEIPGCFTNVQSNPSWYVSLLEELQRMRGRIYVSDGALPPHQLTPDGRHVQDADYRSWHLLGLNRDAGVVGCARYWHLAEPVYYPQLGVSSSALAHDPEWGPKLRQAVEQQIAQAAELGLAFVEVGGWAVTEELRRSAEPLKIALATYALAQSLGGCIGITTATVRHHSSAVLRKIGGGSLRLNRDTEMPRYFDPHYDCDMEILRFDSRAPEPRMSDWIDGLRGELAHTPVMCMESGLLSLQHAVAEMTHYPQSRPMPATVLREVMP
jgi:hypothetical protein